MSNLESIRLRAARGVAASLQKHRNGPEKQSADQCPRERATIRLERLLGGDEPVRNLPERVRKQLGMLKRDPRTPLRLKKAIDRAERIWTHELDNSYHCATCADVRGLKSGEVVRGLDLAPSEDPSDRAHNVREKGTGKLRPSAVGSRNKRRSDFHAVGRLHLRSEMRWITMKIDGAERRILVGPDTHTESIADRARMIQRLTGVNLLGGSMAAAVENALNRGGDEFVERATRAVRAR